MIVWKSTLLAAQARHDAVLEMLRQQLEASERRYRDSQDALYVVMGIKPRETVAPAAAAPLVQELQREPTEYEQQIAIARTPRQFQQVASAELARKWAEDQMRETLEVLNATN